MIAKIIEFLSGIIVAVISATGLAGVALLMAIESACIPLPSEIIMPFAGYLVSKGEMNLWAVGVAGASVASWDHWLPTGPYTEGDADQRTAARSRIMT